MSSFFKETTCKGTYTAIVKSNIQISNKGRLCKQSEFWTSDLSELHKRPFSSWVQITTLALQLKFMFLTEIFWALRRAYVREPTRKTVN